MSYLRNVSNNKVKLNFFDLSFTNLLTCKMGSLVPFLVQEVLPGDRFKIKTDGLIRLAPQIFPTMHNINCYMHYWFVPNRLVWKNWENFITGGEDGQDVSVLPYMKFETGATKSSLLDYLGVPTQVNSNLQVGVVLALRAYNLIFNTWYRDENLQEKVAISLEDGQDTTTNTTLLQRCWQKDYFNSALPWPQKGPAVRIPVGTTAPVLGNGKVLGLTNSSITGGLSADGSNSQRLMASSGVSIGSDVSTAGPTSGSTITGKLGVVQDADNSGLIADLSKSTGLSIPDFRKLFQLQRWMERNARCGSRYNESIMAHFGVRTSDARLQLPEYIGGNKSTVIVSEVLQTSSSDSTSPQGNMAGHGFSAEIGRDIKYRSEEHGYIIGIMSVMPDNLYYQGVRRDYLRKTKEDYFWTEFQHVGEQAVYNSEIYANSSDPEGVFGYQGRYQEERERFGEVHGDFKDTMAFAHLARVFDTQPQLNSSFVQCNPSTRIFSVEKGDHLWCEIANKIYAYRPISKRGEPGFIDHN